MHPSLDFLFRLLDGSYPAVVSAEELDGPHEKALYVCQRMGFLATEPSMNAVPSCPACVAGTPYRQGDRYICNRCRSPVDVRQLQLWRFDLPSLLRWFSGEQHLQGDIERIDDGLWRLGTLDAGGGIRECFYVRGAGCSDRARERLAAFQRVVLLHGKREPPRIEAVPARSLLFADTVTIRGERLDARPLPAFFERQRTAAVRFHPATGQLSLGDALLGRIAAGTREFAFLERLSDAQGEVIAYGELKRAVCRATGSIDSRDEATFCHRLKSRLKKNHGITAIDRLIEADRAQGGYRLLREASLSEAAGVSWDGGRIAGGIRTPAWC